jgi:pimeloyl-ACP methyl ester carboxylesterase
MTAPADPTLERRPDATDQPLPVVMLHGSGNSGAMWRRVAEALPGCRTIAPDLIGYGAAPGWPPDPVFDVTDELDAIASMLPKRGTAFHLLGYSYGGCVALALALGAPRRVQSLTLIEPVFPHGLRYGHENAAYREICRLRDEFVAMTTRGHRNEAMRWFVDFWTGDGAFDALSDAARAATLKCADKIVLDFQSAFSNDPGTARLAALDIPVALLCGDRSPEPMRRLVEVLHGLMPGSSRMVIAGANHLLPFTHAPAVVAALTAQIAAG